jgi:hypothetical protein
MPTTTVTTVTELPVPQPDLSARAWASLPATTELFSDETVWDVTAFGAGMVAVGMAYPDGWMYPAVWTSPDGLAWSRVPHDEETFGAGMMWAIQSDGERLVAVGSACDDLEDCSMRPTVWTSIDGSSWQRVAHDPTVFGIRGDMHDLVAYENGWLSVGSSCDDDTSCSAAAWSSPDGISWTRTLLSDIGHLSEPSVTRGDGLFVMVTTGLVSEVWTSSDGVEWLRVEHDPALFGTEQPTDELWSANMESVTYSCFDQATCGFTAVGHASGNDDERARIWTSTDGSTWTVAFEGPADSAAMDVAADGDTIVAVGSAIWRTVDGVTWVQVANPEPYQLSWAVAAGTTNWVSVPGESHPIWVSPPPN